MEGIESSEGSRLVRRLILTLLVFWGAANTTWGSPEPSPLVLSFDDVISRTLDHNDSIRLAILDYEISRVELEASPFDFDPLGTISTAYRRTYTLSNSSLQSPASVESQFGGGLGVKKKFNIGTTAELSLQILEIRDNNTTSVFPVRYQSGSALSLTQPLLQDFGRAINEIVERKALERYQRYRWKLLQTVDESIVNSGELFWELVRAEREVAIHRSTLAITEENFRSDQALHQAGRKASVDVLQTEAQIGLAKARLASAQSDYVEAEEKLIREIFPSESLPVGVRLQPVAPVTSIQEFEQLIAATPPERSTPALWNYRIASVRQELAEAELEQEEIRNKLLPQLDLEVKYTTTGVSTGAATAISNMFRQLTPSVDVALIFSFYLGNNAAEGSYRESFLERLKKETELERELASTELEISNSRQGIAKSIEILKSVRERVARSLEIVKAKKRFFQAGRIHSREYFDSVTNYYNLLLVEARESSLLQIQALKWKELRDDLRHPLKTAWLSKLKLTLSDSEK